ELQRRRAGRNRQPPERCIDGEERVRVLAHVAPERRRVITIEFVAAKAYDRGAHCRVCARQPDPQLTAVPRGGGNGQRVSVPIVYALEGGSLIELQAQRCLGDRLGKDLEREFRNQSQYSQ